MKEVQPEIVMMDPESLTPYVNNSKKHPIEQIDKIAQQIAAFGFTQPIVVDKDHVIIVGHGRREASRRLGLKSVPVIVRDDLDDNEVKAMRIADNKVAESEWDNDMLRFEFGTLQRNDFDIKLTGFELGEVDRIMIVDEVDEEESNDPTEPPEQFIVSVKLGNEEELRSLYDELINRKFNVKIIR